jgi:hypothetical protein
MVFEISSKISLMLFFGFGVLVGREVWQGGGGGFGGVFAGRTVFEVNAMVKSGVRVQVDVWRCALPGRILKA